MGRKSKSKKNKGSTTASETPEPALDDASLSEPDGVEEKVSGSAESKGQMLQRHKLEVRKFQLEAKNKLKTIKKERNKDLKRELETQLKDEEEALTERHKQELQTVDGEKISIAQDAVLDEQPDEVAVDGKELSAKQLKAIRKRQAKAQKEKEKEQQRIEDSKNIVSQRDIEVDIIQRKLHSVGYIMKEMLSDGNCMYRAVADQLEMDDGGKNTELSAMLRRITSKYMTEHCDDFMPFISYDDDDELSSMEEKYAAYCKRVAETNEWGGQIELRALSSALQRTIIVFSAETKEVVMGEEFQTSQEPIRLTYHLHYYSLGEHYNSVRRIAQ